MPKKKQSGPMLYEIPLDSMVKVGWDEYSHPNIIPGDSYLVKYCGRWYLGHFSEFEKEHGKMRFYCDMMSFNLHPGKDWEKIYAVELDEKTAW